MRLNFFVLTAVSICAGCATPPPAPPNLVDFTVARPIGVTFDRLDGLSHRCLESAGLTTNSTLYEVLGSGEIDLKAQDGSVALAMNLKALSPGQTAVKITYPCCVEPSRLQTMQTYAERETTSCPASPFTTSSGTQSPPAAPPR